MRSCSPRLTNAGEGAIEDAVWGALTGFQHTNTQYFLTLLRVVHTISTHGNCIIVGRAANYVSRDHAKTLHIRVVAPLQARVRNYAAESEYQRGRGTRDSRLER